MNLPFAFEMTQTDKNGDYNICVFNVENATVTCTWGKTGGALQTESMKVKKGRQNRTPHEQAVFEARMTIEKMKRDGWKCVEHTK
jgi:hypothetical protein